MIEPEMAFYELEDNMRLAEEFLKYIIRYVLDHCREDLEFFNQFIEKSVLATLEHVAESDFGHITYTDAVERAEKIRQDLGVSRRVGQRSANRARALFVRRSFQETGDRHRLSESDQSLLHARQRRRQNRARHGRARAAGRRDHRRQPARRAPRRAAAAAARRGIGRKSLTGGISTCAATAPCPTPASASAWSA